MPPINPLLALLLCGSAWSAADSAIPGAGRSFPLELGGFFTYDLDAPASKWQDVDVPMSLSWMELSAQIPVAPHLMGSITLLSKDGPRDIRVWQCVAAWEDSGTSLVVGQQNFHHGILATRLVTSPLFWDSAWRNAPGVEASRTLGGWTLGVGGASPVREGDSSSGPSSDPSASAYLDWIPSDGSLLRLSGAAARRWRDIDAAANLALGPLLFDAEGFWRFKDDKGDLYAGSVGLAWQRGRWTFGTRYDRMTLDGGDNWSGRASGGIVAQFWQVMFAGLEVTRTDRGSLGFDIQVGLSSHTKVPGFTPQQPGR